MTLPLPHKDIQNTLRNSSTYNRLCRLHFASEYMKDDMANPLQLEANEKGLWEQRLCNLPAGFAGQTEITIRQRIFPIQNGIH